MNDIYQNGADPKALYFDTLAGAVDAIFARAYADRCVFSKPTEVWDLCRDHLAYDTNRTGDFQLDTFKGKPTRKYYHALICRLSSGHYELTTYAL
jgi:hypothetical protein